AGRHALPFALLTIDVWEGVCERRRGRLAVAGRLLDRAIQGFERVDSPAWRTLARMERALVAGLSGTGTAALRELASAARDTRRSGDRKELARNALFEARVLQVMGRRFAAPLDRALALIEREDYGVLLRKEGDVAAPLLAAADATPRVERARAALPVSGP